MKSAALPPALFLLLLNFSPVLDALRLPLTSRGRVPPAKAPRSARTRRDQGDATLVDQRDLEYWTTLSLNGSQFDVVVDTGSSDLWVAGNVNGATDTGRTATVQYAVGSANGPIKLAQLDLAGYIVPNQAFLQVPPSSKQPSGQGLIGLGPNWGSNIYYATPGLGAGDAPLDRIFQQSPSTPNFVTVRLGRGSTDSNKPKLEGDLTVGEVLTGYEAVQQQPKLDVVQASDSGHQHWQVALTGITAPNGNSVTLTKDGATQTSLNAVLDTGFSFPQVSEDIAAAIYSDIPGAKMKNINGVGRIWTLPCSSELYVRMEFGSVTIPVHPLDTVFDSSIHSDCIGAFQPISSASDSSYDMILGMAFLRNTYMLINYGDFAAGSNSHVDPYIQLLPTSNDTSQMHTEFVAARAARASAIRQEHVRIAEIVAPTVFGILLVLVLAIFFGWRRARRRNRADNKADRAAAAALNAANMQDRGVYEPLPIELELGRLRGEAGGPYTTTPARRPPYHRAATSSSSAIEELMKLESRSSSYSRYPVPGQERSSTVDPDQTLRGQGHGHKGSLVDVKLVPVDNASDATLVGTGPRS